MQRLRVRFSRGEEIKFISHLDLIRLWQRALQRAGIPLAYSEGFNPRPRLSLAAPLAVGITSEAELMDIYCTRVLSPHWFTSVVNQQLPPGVNILQAYQIAPILPSLQSLLRQAEYQVKVESARTQEEIEAKIADMLGKEHLPWQHQRDTGPRSYDLRALMNDLWLVEYSPGCCTLGMMLRCDSGGSGRPEQVVAAMGFSQPPFSIHRTKLTLKTG